MIFYVYTINNQNGSTPLQLTFLQKHISVLTDEDGGDGGFDDENYGDKMLICPVKYCAPSTLLS